MKANVRKRRLMPMYTVVNKEHVTECPDLIPTLSTPTSMTLATSKTSPYIPTTYMDPCHEY